MGSNDSLRAVRVGRIVPLDPTMVRVTFAADGPVPEAVRVPAGHCRLRFPDDADPARLWPRVFTYRRWHPDGRFDVDFALHGGTGPAARWIARAVPGDVIGWTHGGAPKLTLGSAPEGPILAYGDATARPVISALLERAHPGLTGQVFLELPRAARAWPVPAPPGVSIHVLRSVTPAATVDTVKARLALRPATVLVACEASRMRALRRFVLDELRVQKARVFTSGYWKAGLATEAVDAEKRRPDWFGDRVDTMAPERGTAAGG